MKKWQQFENDCFNHLLQEYINNPNIIIELRGNYTSNTSDIYVQNNGNNYFIEVKMPVSQSGQFVVYPNNETELFELSNQSALNQTPTQLECTNAILQFISQPNHYAVFANAGTRGMDLDIPDIVLKNWIVEHYYHKNVRYIMTYMNQQYILIPIHEIDRYFYISATCRKKRSGSSRFSIKHIDDLNQCLIEQELDYHFCDENNTIQLMNYHEKQLKVHPFLLKQVHDNVYNIRKLSNTNNYNIIFKLKLKKDIF